MRVVEHIIGVGRSLANLEQAVALGVVDEYTDDAAAAVDGADMVVVAVTLGATAGVLEAIVPALGADTVVTDVGSVKLTMVEAARAHLGANFANFVPAHPIAGTEHSGDAASLAELFVAHKVILTPHARTSAAALARVAQMWRAAGASVVEMDIKHHDQILAATSHLPHMLAYALVDTLAVMPNADEIFAYAVGGFRDFTRIASSSPEIWRDIALANRDQLSAVCDGFQEVFDKLKAAIVAGDAERIAATFARAKDARDRCEVPTADERNR